MQSKRYSTLFALLIVAMLASTALSSIVVRRCNPGQKYFDGCNNCMCTPEEEEVCTYKRCHDFDGKENVPRPRLEAPEGFWAPLDVVKPPHA